MEKGVFQITTGRMGVLRGYRLSIEPLVGKLVWLARLFPDQTRYQVTR